MNLNKVYIGTGNGAMEQLLLPPPPHDYSPLINYKPGNLILHNGNIYICKQDNGPSSIEVAPGDNDEYWTQFNIGNTISVGGIWNKQDIVEESGTYIAPITGWYRITLIGGGGGGSGGIAYASASAISGGVGGDGENKTVYLYIEENIEINVVIGAGGSQGFGGGGIGNSGGDTSISYDAVLITAQGGQKNKGMPQGGGISGGSGITKRRNGENGTYNSNPAASTPDAISSFNEFNKNTYFGAGGYGGRGSNGGSPGPGGPGIQGVVVFEYFQY